MASVELICMKPKECGKIKEIIGCGSEKKRLYELGLNKGANIKMVKNDFGPVILNLSGNKLALGRGLALNIIVSR